ncbi:hypothetical protein [Lewinella sp. W8]|uniref:hypothetical protein n=1 Tax=Lewinella sp. W8 TaxID=2528208 RepID=UPI0010673084|nr:hypothetical protein [Lewinella sp. W8]MTB52181.1 hypothetical protein [Lewinella sp. W8]
MSRNIRKYYYLALFGGLVLHGGTLLFTFEGTYDAFVHLFFADHYASHWFETWNYQWYTGFTVTSYPPLVHHVIALLSKVVGLKAGFLLWSFFVILVFIRGVFQFSRIWVGEEAAAYAAILAVFSTSFGEALHIFGQLPSITGVAFLLNACPELYAWLRHDERWRLFTGLSILAITSSAHHVTTIFGMVFFVLPTLGLAVMNRAADRSGDDDIHFRDIFAEVIRVLPRAVFFGIAVITITAIVIFPYWYWSKSDPITQVSIPHGSRDNFLEVTSSGLVFFLIPWGMMLFFLPFLFRELFRKRNIFLGLSIGLAFLLGTGGTTPLPRMMLGETAFNILTLDRFTYWASLLSLPFWGYFFYHLAEGRCREYLVRQWGRVIHGLCLAFFIGGTVISALVVVNFQNFRATQPTAIDMDPIVSFLERDQHHKWRFLTLGFGDQMAWLSSQTDALSVDGNYHSVRRLPELTSRAVERLENAKYLGADGISSLQQFLTVPEKYHLKYIFSNDKFYDPLLFFCGWNRVQQLENNIVIWEKPDIPTLPSVLPRKNQSSVHRLMWGILPISCLLFGLLLNVVVRLRFGSLMEKQVVLPRGERQLWTVNLIWAVLLFAVVSGTSLVAAYQHYDHATPEQLIDAYFGHLDFKRFQAAHQCFDPDNRPSLEQYLLELSVEGGILSSYAKLDTLEVEWLPTEGAEEKHAMVTATWLTAIRTYRSVHDIQLVRRGLRWYLRPFTLEQRTPPDQFVRLPSVDFHSQGKRRTVATTVEKRDVRDRPDVYVLSAALVNGGGTFAVTGQILNVDNDPAYLTVEATVYDSLGQEIGRYNARDVVQHILYPKEHTGFRVDVEEGMLDAGAVPASFDLSVRSMVAANETYKRTGVQGLRLDQDRRLHGELLNYGARQIIVPQGIINYYDQGGDMVWADAFFLEGGIRPQRRKAFTFSLKDLTDFRIVQRGNDDRLRVNGVSRRAYREALNFPASPDAYRRHTFRLPGEGSLDLSITAQMASFSDE